MFRSKACAMRMRLKYTTPLWVVAAAAVAIGAAPIAAANPSQETCTSLGSSATRCQSPGNAEINDSLPAANVLPQFSYFGGQSTGPYGGPGGGAG
jgi:hypothetical protein